MKLVQVWIICFLVFFGAAELYQWFQGITLPLPVFVVAGALLATASNVDKIFRKSNLLRSIESPSQRGATQSADPLSSNPAPSPLRYYAGPQLPNLLPQARRSISFTIRNPQPVSKKPDLGE